MITAEQCKASRAILNWTHAELSAECGVSLRTIQEFERSTRRPNQTTLQALLAAFERAGIEFGPEGATLSCGSLRGITRDPRDIGRGSELE